MIRQRTLLVGTTNKNKLAELQCVADEFQIKLCSLTEYQQAHSLPPPPVVEEDGTTYLDNVRLKAHAYANWAGVAVLADDSGLEVEILDGAPGVSSAVYVAPDASYPERMRSLVEAIHEAEQLRGIKNRRARFRCTLLLAEPRLFSDRETGETDETGETLAEGVLDGEILDALQGTKGFGYDPIFYLPELGKTLAELDLSHTARIGFRGKAARKLFQSLA